MTKNRNQIGILVTKDFKKVDMEFQKLCEQGKMSQSRIIRDLIKEWVKRNKDTVKNIYYT